jgi:hypothetical protein
VNSCKQFGYIFLAPGVPGLCSGLHSITTRAIRASHNPRAPHQLQPLAHTLGAARGCQTLIDVGLQGVWECWVFSAVIFLRVGGSVVLLDRCI